MQFNVSFAQGEVEEPIFKISNDERGISVKHNSTDDFTPTQYLGVGQAWGDFNGDGFDDLYVTRQSGANILYENVNGEEFVISPFSTQVAEEGVKSGGATFADFDNDNDQDLYVSNHGRNTLFENRGEQGFIDITDVAGVGDPNKGSSSSWADFDQDGDLDLFSSNWMCDNCRDGPFDDMADRLYQNNGDGTFKDVSSLLDYEYTIGAGFIGAWFDYDNDQDLDLYIVNDKWANPIGNVMFRNDGAGCDGWCFTEVSKETGTDIEVYGMGITIGDIDHDFDLDFYVSNMGEHVMMLNDGEGNYEDYTVKTNTIVQKTVGWSVLFSDFNNDKFEDLFAAATHPKSNLFQNTGDGYFEKRPILDRDITLQGTAYTDYNNDGWIDIVGGQRNGEYLLLENTGYDRAEADNSWISFDLQGTGDINLDATGARMYLRTTDGLGHMKEIHNGIGLGGGSSQMLHFGLGTDDIEQAIVTWPDGTMQNITEFGLNQINKIEYQPDGRMTHQEIIEFMDLNSFYNPLIDQEGVVKLVVISTSVALFVIIALPIITLKLQTNKDIVEAKLS